MSEVKLSTIVLGDQAVQVVTENFAAIDAFKVKAGDAIAKMNAKTKVLKIGDNKTIEWIEVPVADAAAIEAAMKSVESYIHEQAKQIPTGDAIEKLVALRTKTIGDAQKLMPKIAVDGKDLTAIKREAIKSACDSQPAVKNAVTAAMGGVDIATADEAAVNTGFAVAVATMPAQQTSGIHPVGDENATARAFAGAPASVVVRAGDGKADGPKLTGRAAFLNSYQK